MSEQDLADSILRHALELQRLSEYEEGRADAELRALAEDLRILLGRQTISEAGKREIRQIIKAADDAIAGRYVNIAAIVDEQGVLEHVVQRTVDILQGQTTITVTPARVMSLAKTVLIDGAPSAAWWARQAQDLQFRFANIVRQGVINGRTNEQIVREVAGRGGIMDTSRRNARALVHSSIMTAANRARMDTYRQAFGKHAKGVEWMATLDSHTCVQCAALDGSQWDFDGHRIGKTKLDFQVAPAHFNCRCVMTPVLGGKLDEIFGTKGLDEKLAARPRASAQGPVDDRTFNSFLKRQSPDFIEDVLGTKRAELYQRGKITLTDLVTRAGREKTLAELQ